MSDQVNKTADQKPAADLTTNPPEKDKAVPIDSGAPKPQVPAVESVKPAEADKERKQA